MSRAWSIVLSVSIAAVIVVSVAFRFIGLATFPGLNADEAYYPVAMIKLRDGEPQALVSGSGLPLNPLYSVPVFLLHFGHPTPSVGLVRLPALASGLLLILVAFPWLTRVFDRWTALYATLLLACLPVAIAYSRFGWDQSQAPLVGLACLYFCLQRRTVFLAIAYLTALWVHPINAFLGPILLGPVAARDIVAWTRQPAEVRAQHVRRAIPWLAVAALAAGVLAFAVTREGSNAPLSAAIQRLTDLGGWGEFALLTGDFFSGTTIYTYLAGEPPAAWIYFERVVFWGVVLSGLVAAVPRWYAQRDSVRLGLLSGMAMALVLFYLALGVGTVTPGWERYSMWLVSPACVIAAMLLSSLGDSAKARRMQIALLTSACVLILIGFYGNYIRVFTLTGGDGTPVARTGVIEPKQQAFNAIVRASQGEPAVTVLTEDWWSYYPLRYLAAERRNMHVVMPGSRLDVSAGPFPGRIFAVGFPDGGFERWIDRQAAQVRRESALDPVGRALFHVWDFGHNGEYLDGLTAAGVALR